MLRDTPTAAALSADDLGAPLGERATLVQFSSAFCRPCVATRQVLDGVAARVDGVAHVEIDMDTNPAAARRLSVLSLPTTFIFDRDGRQRYRTAGVPKAADLRSALVPLLT